MDQRILQIIQKHPELKSEFEEIYPELKESEDERIRFAMIRGFNSMMVNHPVNTFAGVSIRDIIAYLEKQKENPKTVDSIPSFCVSNVKWVDTIITMAIVALSDDVDYNRDEPCKYRQEIDDLKKLRDVLCGKKEQKSAEKQDYIELNDLERAIHRGFLSAGVENVPVTIIRETAKECLAQVKPVEWNKEDELKRDNLIGLVEEIKRQPLKRLEDWDGYISWLKSLPKRFNLQPKQEWSEDDETAFKCIKSILIDYMSENYKGSKYCTNEQVKEWIKWFDIVFHSLCPQPHWKPSEEQMEILGRFNDPVLKSLYSDLQKLL